jgi:CRP-like cAMP-binding protein
MSNPLLSFLKLFTDISLKDETIISSAIELRTYKENDFLLKEGSIAKNMFFIIKGVVKIVAINDKGNESTYFFLKENQFCTILNSFNKQDVAKESIKAACNVDVIVLERKKLLAVYKEVPYIKELITQISQQALLDKIEIRNAYHGQDSTTRYKTFMMRQPDIALRVSITDIASYLGITPQSLSRIRKNIR